jgi:hypothetical protein
MYRIRRGKKEISVLSSKGLPYDSKVLQQHSGRHTMERIRRTKAEVSVWQRLAKRLHSAPVQKQLSQSERQCQRGVLRMLGGVCVRSS